VVNEVKCTGVGRIPLCIRFQGIPRMHHFVSNNSSRCACLNDIDMCTYMRHTDRMLTVYLTQYTPL
jgi:hypothetical protein